MQLVLLTFIVFVEPCFNFELRYLCHKILNYIFLNFFFQKLNIRYAYDALLLMQNGFMRLTFTFIVTFYSQFQLFQI